MLTVHPKYRFGGFDEVVVAGVSFRPISANTRGVQMARTDATDVVEFFRNEDIEAHVTAGRIIHRRDKFRRKDPRRAGAQDPVSALRGLNDAQSARLAIRHAFTAAFEEAHHLGAVKRTHGSVTNAMPLLRRRAEELLREQARREDQDDAMLGLRLAKLREKSSTTLMRWLRGLDSSGLAGLTDNWGRSGRRQQRLTADESAILQTWADAYMSDLKPTQAAIYRGMCDEFREVHAERQSRGAVTLQTPSREALRQAIKALDPFLVDLRRLGEKQALRLHRPKGEGVRPTRALERVEMDEWPVDLVTWMKAHGLGDYLSDDQLKGLGLDGERDRWAACVAMCVTTRCIVGMKLTRNPKASTALQTLEMAINPKAQIAEELQTRSPWSMHGLPEAIVVDNGSAFLSQDFETSLGVLGITKLNPPPAQPHLRGAIERFFRTMASQLMVELKGRTFSNPTERGDYESEKQAVLDAGDFAEIAVRWFVDVYHNTPHPALNGRTPIEAWEALQDEGVSPPPDRRTQRMAFGVARECVVTQEGVTVLGMHYHSRELAEWRMHTPGDRKVLVQWSPSDIGAIDVRIGDRWIEVEAVAEAVRHGVNARMWSAVVRAHRRAARDGAAANAETISDALERIRAVESAATVRVGLLTDEWTEARIAREEANAFLGFRYDGAARTTKVGSWGAEIPTDGPRAAEVINTASPISAPRATTASPRREPKHGAAPSPGAVADSGGWSVME